MLRAMIWLMLALTPIGAAAQQNVALVIGNGAYQAKNVPPLSNPAKDAKAAARKLRDELGYTVFDLIDAPIDQMDAALRRFSSLARNARVALV